jgi:hypothetical protein
LRVDTQQTDVEADARMLKIRELAKAKGYVGIALE